MRILHVVPLSEDQLDGDGRAAVAVNQCRELLRRGHEVHLLVIWHGGGNRPATVLDGLTTHLVGDLPRLLGWLRRHLAAFDLAHLHLGRDAATTSTTSTVAAAAAARRAGVPYVVQSHPVRSATPRFPAGLVDRHLLAPAVRRAEVRLAPDPAERTVLERLAETGVDAPRPGSWPVHLLADAVPVPDPAETLRTESARSWTAATAPAQQGRLDVLCAGGLGDVVDTDLLVGAVLAAVRQGVPATVTVAGRDAGGLGTLTSAIDTHPELDGRLRIETVSTHAALRRRLARAELFLLPVRPGARSGTLLEALMAGVPTVCTSDVQQALPLRSRQGARVVPPTRSALATALADLAGDEEARADLGRRGHAVARLLFGAEAMADRLEGHYAAAVQGRPGRRPTVPVPVAVPGQGGPQSGERTGATVIDLSGAAPAPRPAAVPPARRPGADEGAAWSGERLLWVTAEVDPGRLALWREIGRSADLTVAVLGAAAAALPDPAAETFHQVRLDHGAGPDAADLQGAPRLLRTLVRARPDAVVLDGWRSPAFTTTARWARRAGVPVVASYRSSGSAAPEGDGPEVPRSLRRLLRRADSVLATGPEALTEVIHLGVPPERVALAPVLPDLPPAEQAHGGRTVVDVRPGHRFLHLGGDPVGQEEVLQAYRLARGMDDVLTVAADGARELVAEATRIGVAEHLVAAATPGAAGRAPLIAAAHTVVVLADPLEPAWADVAEVALRAGRHVVVCPAGAATGALAGAPGVYPAQADRADLARAMMASRQAWTLAHGRADQVLQLPDGAGQVPAGRGR